MAAASKNIAEGQLRAPESASPYHSSGHVASFDIFDTLLTRSVTDPAGVFYFIGRRATSECGLHCTAERFARSRQEAEHRLFSATGLDPSLEEIYTELGNGLHLSAKQREQLLNLELSVEEELIRAVPTARERIQRAVTQGSAVLYISDMYLPSGFLKRQLAKHELWVPEARLFVSSEARATKRSGALFRSALNSAGVSISSVTHCGNDRIADEEVPRRLGIAVQPDSSCNPNRYETLLEKYRWDTGGGTSLLAGASRLARLRVPVSTAREATLRDVAAGLGGPVLTAYVLWVLERARQLDLERLYFVSRDGYILLRIAEKLARPLGVRCELRYLYGSREAWHAAALATLGGDRLAVILESANSPTVTQLLARVGLIAERLEQRLSAWGFIRSSWNQPLAQGEREKLLGYLRSDYDVQETIRNVAEEKRALLAAYLRQEKLTESGRAATVDVGWYGRSFDSLASVLRGIGAPVPRGFFFGLHSQRDEAEDPPREAYFFDKRIPRGFVDCPHGLANLMEILCAAPHGQVVAYKADGEAIAPVLRMDGNPSAVEWGLPLVQQTIGEYVEEVSSNLHMFGRDCDLRPAVDALIRSFWIHPSRQEAAAWGSFRYFDDQDESTWSYLAEPYKVWEALKIISTGNSGSLVYWPEGSLALTRPVTCWLVKGSEKGHWALRKAGSRTKKFLKSAIAGSQESADTRHNNS